MEYFKKHLIPILLILSDAFVCFISVVITYWARTYLLSSIVVTAPEFHPFSIYLKAFPYVFFIWLAVFYFNGLYSIKRSTSRLNESLQIFKSLSLVILAVMAGFFFHHVDFFI